MSSKIRVFLLFEAATFVAASLIHSGALIGGYEHQKARIAEGVIANRASRRCGVDLDPPGVDTMGRSSRTGIRITGHTGRNLYDLRRGGTTNGT